MKGADCLGAKRAFVFANRLKVGPFESADALLAASKATEVLVDRLSIAELDAIVEADGDRLRRYNNARWRLAALELGPCAVWPKMGEREWAVGTVENVARLFTTKADTSDRIFQMMALSSVYRQHFPLVLFNSSNGLWLDDGNHRAVAMYLAGVRTAPAWVGE